MTDFEQLAQEMKITIECDENGFYIGKCSALAQIVNSIILSDDETIFNLPWDEQKKIIKENFYKIFPYMA